MPVNTYDYYQAIRRKRRRSTSFDSKQLNETKQFSNCRNTMKTLDNCLGNNSDISSLSRVRGGPPSASMYDKKTVMMRVQFQITAARETSPILLSPPSSPTADEKEYPLIKSASASLCENSNSYTQTVGNCLQMRLLHDQHAHDQPKLLDNDNEVHQAGNSRLESKRLHRRRPSTTIGVNLDSKGGFTSYNYDKRVEYCAHTSHVSHSSSDHTTRCISHGSFKRTASVRTTSNTATSLHHSSLSNSSSCSASQSKERCNESIYFKRDGQRFGHEFTLKLSVDCSYKCLLKIKPSIPLRSISIQGHDINFYDCTQSTISSITNSCDDDNQQQNERTLHANVAQHFLNNHLAKRNSDQLMYVFDWSASRFDVNKNKNRTEVQMMLRFDNGQTLALPLQVKFYHSDRRQHLNWGKYTACCLTIALII